MDTVNQDKEGSHHDHQEELKGISKVDTLHQDEAMNVITGYDGDEITWTDEEERRLVRKIDRKLVPIMFITYGLVYYDKAMLSQAALFGLRTELELTGNRYSVSSSIFYLWAMAGALPVMMLAQKFPVERVATGIIAIWGVNLMLTIECRTFKGLYANRFFLGFLGLSPMLMIIVASFYKKSEQPFRIGSWWSAGGLFSMFSPLINYGLGHVHHNLSPWKYMYIFAGSITILWAVVIYFYLPPEPIHAKGFTKRERYIAVARLRGNNAGVRNTHIKLGQALEVLRDLRFWLVFFCAFCIMIANDPLSTYLPIIISGFGYTPLESLLLSMPAGAMAGICTLLSTWLAGRYSHRGWRTYLMGIFQVPIILASLLLWQLPPGNTAARLAGIYLLGDFASPYGVLMSLQAVNTAGYTKKTVTASGNFTGPLLFRPQDAPLYENGWKGVVVTSVAVFVLIAAYRVVYMLKNKRRDNSGIAEGLDNAFEDDLTDMKNPQFLYQL